MTVTIVKDDRQAAEAAARAAMTRARTMLVLSDRDARSVFFSSLLLRLKASPDWSLPTMGTDGRRLLYNPEFTLSLGQEQLRGVLIHEVMHCVLDHQGRRGGRDPVLWNVAADLAVNPILEDSRFCLPAGALFPGQKPFEGLPKGKSADWYYAALQESGFTAQGGPGDDPGGCGGVQDAGGGGEAEAAASQAEWRVAVAQASQASQQAGKLPGDLARLVGEVLSPRVPWYEVLRRFVSSHARNDYCWSRPNRRHLAAGLYLPGMYSEELGDVAVAVDTSGSITPQLLSSFAGEAQGVLEAFDCRCTLIYCDARVHLVQEWSRQDGPLRLEAVGGGGTSHVPVFEWLEASGRQFTCLICLTDLYTAFPERHPEVPTLWCVYNNPEPHAPFGEVVSVQ